MPELSRFYGIIIRMFYGNHAPPHFHAAYQGEEVQVNIETLEVITGRISRRALAFVLEWASLHREELRRAWAAAAHNQEPDKIAPLD
jgi:hypothetical protein